jgi:hypothetical protein
MDKIGIFDRENQIVYVITYEPSTIKLQQEKARIVTNFYTSQYLLKIPFPQQEDFPVDFSQYEEFDQRTYRFSIATPEILPIKDEVYVGFYTIWRQWDIARSWFIKLQWDSKAFVDTNKKVRDSYKPRGLLLQSYYRLCKECHARQDFTNIEIPYSNATKWFSAIFFNLLLINVGRSIAPDGTYKIDNGNIKQARLGIEKDDLKLLKAETNPFIPASTNTRAISILIDSCLFLVSHSDIFRNQYWKPHLKAISSHINEMNKPGWGRNIVVEGKHYVQSGRGKGQIFKGKVEADNFLFSEPLPNQASSL